MARARNIKPSIMDNEDLAELEPIARLLFIYLWMLADRDGRLEDRPKRIAAKALPYDRSADVNALLDALQEAKFILRYVADGKPCIQILTFIEHQRPHPNEAPSDLPPVEGQGPVEARRNPVEECFDDEDLLPRCEGLPTKEESTLPLTSDSLNDDSLNVGKGERAGKPPRRKRLEAMSLPVEWERYCLDKHHHRIPADEFEKFADYHRSKGNAMADWPAAWRTWLRNADKFAANEPSRQHPRLTANQQMQQNVIGALTGRRNQGAIDVEATEVCPPAIARR